jgi:hypothetical protein
LEQPATARKPVITTARKILRRDLNISHLQRLAKW